MVLPIDFDDLTRRTLGDQPLVRELLDLFRQEAGPLMARLRHASDTADAPAADAVAHRLGGSAATIAAVRLAELLRTAGRHWTHGHPATAAAALPAIEEELDACLRQIDAQLDGTSLVPSPGTPTDR